MTLERTDAVFSSTRVSLLRALDADDPAARRAALDAVIRQYWPAIYAFFRRRGVPREQAAELAQSFLAEVGVGRGLFQRHEGSRGRLRTLLMRAARNHSISRHRRECARGRARSLSDADLAAGIEPGFESITPEEAFDRTWASLVIRETTRRTEAHFAGSGRAAHWEAFRQRVLLPASSSTDPPDAALLASILGFRSAADLHAAVQVVKRRWRALLQEVAGETSDDPSAEVDYLRRILSSVA